MVLSWCACTPVRLPNGSKLVLLSAVAFGALSHCLFTVDHAGTRRLPTTDTTAQLARLIYEAHGEHRVGDGPAPCPGASTLAATELGCQPKNLRAFTMT